MWFTNDVLTTSTEKKKIPILILDTVQRDPCYRKQRVISFKAYQQNGEPCEDNSGLRHEEKKKSNVNATKVNGYRSWSFSSLQRMMVLDLDSKEKKENSYRFNNSFTSNRRLGVHIS